jgi:pimeloyl-ACP methyl ester carboxylesterase
MSAREVFDGHWEGVMVRGRAQLEVSFDFSQTRTAPTGDFSAQTLRAINIPLRNVMRSGAAVHFELTGDITTTVFDGQLTDSSIAGQFHEGAVRDGQFREGDARTGRFREGEARGTFRVTLKPSRPKPFAEQEVMFRNVDVALSGTLLLPLNAGRHPAVVFLHGSGAEGRFASRFFAEQCARAGIAALIYDKRGVGRSTGDWQQADFTDLAEDALAAIHLLQRRKDIDPTKVGIQGHSQGGMIAPLVAARSQDVAFVISTGGQGVPLYEGEIYSMTNQLRSQGVSGSELAEATELIQLRVNVARTGDGWEQLDAAVARARSTRWYPFARVPPRENWTWAFFKRIYSYNATEYWTQVKVPALIMYGERDLLSPVEPSVTNIAAALTHAGNHDYTVLIVPRASHTFMIEPDPTGDFDWPRLAPGLPDLFTAWISQRMK